MGTRWVTALAVVGALFGAAACGVHQGYANNLASDVAKIPGVKSAEGQHITFKSDHISIDTTLAPDGDGTTIRAVIDRVRDDVATAPTQLELSISKPIGPSRFLFLPGLSTSLTASDFDHALGLATEFDKAGAVSSGITEMDGQNGVLCGATFASLTDEQLASGVELMAAEPLCLLYSVGSELMDKQGEFFTLGRTNTPAQLDLMKQLRRITHAGRASYVSMDFTSEESPFVFLSFTPEKEADDTAAMSEDELRALLEAIHASKQDVRLSYFGVPVTQADGVMTVESPFQDEQVGRRPEFERLAREVASQLG